MRGNLHSTLMSLSDSVKTDVFDVESRYSEKEIAGQWVEEVGGGVLRCYWKHHSSPSL